MARAGDIGSRGQTAAADAMTGIEIIETAIAPARARLLKHPIYKSLKSIEDVRVFMGHHVFAVWDFMSLLKGLQRALTSVELPWRPVGSASARRFINSIVLEEESDAVDGRPFSHYELYAEAMREVGADPAPCDKLIAKARSLDDLPAALKARDIPPAARAFVKATFGFIATGKPHVIAAAFTFGREEPIPDMFRALLARIEKRGAKVETLKLYLERHIHLDEGEHGPMAEQMLAELCGDDPVKWAEAAEAAVAAIEARLALWDGVVAAIEKARG